jgi:hypothetical protein
VQTKRDVGCLTISLTEPTVHRLDTVLAAIVRRAHASGLKAATIAHPPGEPPAPRQRPDQISLPDGVSGRVTVADRPDRLAEFVVELADLVGPRAVVEIDGVPVECQRQPSAPRGASVAGRLAGAGRKD